MKENKLTFGSNLLWESSRLMLPEHKEALWQSTQESKKQRKPDLDEQELAEINRIIWQAKLSKERLHLTIFAEDENNILTGWVSTIDQHGQRLKLEEEEQSCWISFKAILKAVLD